MGIAQAGVLFFRPCAAVAEHMMRLAQLCTQKLPNCLHLRLELSASQPLP